MPAFKHGDVFYDVIETKAGRYECRAKIVVDGETLIFDDTELFPLTVEGEMQVGVFKAAADALRTRARDDGFGVLHIKGYRTWAGSSANPGRPVDIKVKLKKKSNPAPIAE